MPYHLSAGGGSAIFAWWKSCFPPGKVAVSFHRERHSVERTKPPAAYPAIHSAIKGPSSNQLPQQPIRLSTLAGPPAREGPGGDVVLGEMRLGLRVPVRIIIIIIIITILLLCLIITYHYQHIYMHVYVYIYIYIHKHNHNHNHTCIYIYIYIYTIVVAILYFFRFFTYL